MRICVHIHRRTEVKYTFCVCVCVGVYVCVNSSYLVALKTFNNAKAKVCLAFFPHSKTPSKALYTERASACVDVCGIFMLILIVRSG